MPTRVGVAIAGRPPSAFAAYKGHLAPGATKSDGPQMSPFDVTRTPRVHCSAHEGVLDYEPPANVKQAGRC
jgi:hypothetical protein